MDYKVADLRKKLNRLKHDSRLKTDKIARLMKDYEKVVHLNAEMEKAEEILEDSPEGQRLRFLENEIHKTNLKLMEGETIKKKYMTILDMLKKERLTFGNQIEGLEAQLLGTVVNFEEPELEVQKSKLVLQLAKGKRELADLESTILKMLSEAEGSLLDDASLVDTLNRSTRKQRRIIIL